MAIMQTKELLHMYVYMDIYIYTCMYISLSLSVFVPLYCAVPKVRPSFSNPYFVQLGTPRTTPLPVDSYHWALGPPLELNSNIFLKQGIKYSASRASENGMWDPSATPQDVCTSVSMLKGPAAYNFRNANVVHQFRFHEPSEFPFPFRHVVDLGQNLAHEPYGAEQKRLLGHTLAQGLGFRG